MSEDIRKWSDGRYSLMFDEHTFFVWDNENEKRMNALQTTKKLNEQQATIISLKERNKQLRRRLEKINGGYGHLTHRNGLTANEWVIESQEKELKKKNEQISDWIERHSKDIVKIGEQQSIIQSLKERLYDFERRKIIEESEIDEDVIPKVKLLRTELFGEKYE